MLDNCFRFAPRDSIPGLIAKICKYLKEHPGWSEKELEEQIKKFISATGVESFNGRIGNVTLDKNDVNNLKIASAYFAEGDESIDSLDLVSLYNQGVRFVFTDFNSVTSGYNLAFVLDYFDASGEVAYYPVSTGSGGGGNIVSVNGKTGEVHLKVVDVSNGNSPDENAYIFIDESDDYPDVISSDSSKLGGQLPSYYASAEDVSQLEGDLVKLENTVKSGKNELITKWVLGFPISKTEYGGSTSISTNYVDTSNITSLNIYNETGKELFAYYFNESGLMDSFVNVGNKVDTVFDTQSRTGYIFSFKNTTDIAEGNSVSIYTIFVTDVDAEQDEQIQALNTSMASANDSIADLNNQISLQSATKKNALNGVEFKQGGAANYTGIIDSAYQISTDGFSVPKAEDYYIEFPTSCEVRVFKFDSSKTPIGSFDNLLKSTVYTFDSLMYYRLVIRLKDTSGSITPSQSADYLSVYRFVDTDLKKWCNKKAVFLGDSITYGAVVNTDGHAQVTPYWQYLKEHLRLLNVVGYGLSGSSIGDGVDSVSSFISRYNSMDADADLVVVFGGTNDYGNISASSTATFGDISSTSNSTFYGALKNLIDGLVTKYVGKTIVFMTPIHRENEEANLLGKTLKDYRDAIIEVCELKGIPYIDTFTISGFVPSNSDFKFAYFDSIGLHPTENGQKLLADRIYNNFENF